MLEGERERRGRCARRVVRVRHAERCRLAEWKASKPWAGPTPGAGRSTRARWSLGSASGGDQRAGKGSYMSSGWAPANVRLAARPTMTGSGSRTSTTTDKRAAGIGAAARKRAAPAVAQSRRRRIVARDTTSGEGLAGRSRRKIEPAGPSDKADPSWRPLRRRRSQ